ncbi:NAD(P)-binding protein [Pseudoalteromonas rhizosphaerae]|uniref:NAD(P)-binding protein n=1 Tax=Pseudoalteromonas rhizosphaerae TaxID=2518973 RepID=A0ABW8L1D8_9GAMM
MVGAGPSGIVAVKELIAANHSVTCFEMADNIDGVFNSSE